MYAIASSDVQKFDLGFPHTMVGVDPAYTGKVVGTVAGAGE